MNDNAEPKIELLNHERATPKAIEELVASAMADMEVALHDGACELFDWPTEDDAEHDKRVHATYTIVFEKVLQALHKRFKEDYPT